MTTPSQTDIGDEDLAPLASDTVAIEMNSGVTMDNGGVPTQLLHGGEHFDDMPDRNMRSWRRVSELLPREIMREQVKRMGLKRPAPIALC